MLASCAPTVIDDRPRAKVDESLLADCPVMRSPRAGEAALIIIDRQEAAYEACAARHNALARAVRVLQGD